MRQKVNSISLEEVAKLERKCKFLYFLRDIGIKSAHQPAVRAWNIFMWAQAELTVGG